MSHTPLDLTPIQQRERAAEGTRWVNGGDIYVLLIDDPDGPVADDFHSYEDEGGAHPDRPVNTVCRIRGSGRRAPETANLEFIAHAREDIPALINEVEYLRRANADLLRRLRGIRDTEEPPRPDPDDQSLWSDEQKAAAADQLLRAGFVEGDPVIGVGWNVVAGKIGVVKRVHPRVGCNTFFGTHRYGNAGCEIDGFLELGDNVDASHFRKLTPDEIAQIPPVPAVAEDTR